MITKEDLEQSRYLREYFIRSEAYQLGNRDGRGEGETKAQYEILRHLIKLRFASVSEEFLLRLYHCTTAECLVVVERVFKGSCTLEELFDGLYLSGAIFE